MSRVAPDAECLDIPGAGAGVGKPGAGVGLAIFVCVCLTGSISREPGSE